MIVIMICYSQPEPDTDCPAAEFDTDCPAAESDTDMPNLVLNTQHVTSLSGMACDSYPMIMLVHVIARGSFFIL